MVPNDVSAPTVVDAIVSHAHSLTREGATMDAITDGGRDIMERFGASWVMQPWHLHKCCRRINPGSVHTVPAECADFLAGHDWTWNDVLTANS